MTIQLTMPGAQIFVPDALPADEALGRTTHLAIGAHQDDLELMAAAGILEAYGREDRWFTGVVVTNGSGSPRSGLYERYMDGEMQAVRRKEQNAAAVVGGYAAQVQLDYPSAAVKDAANMGPVADLAALLRLARPEIVYIHNLADKHDTHVSVALRALAALRSLPADARPAHVYGCEVWRDLDWVVDTEKVTFDTSDAENLQAALLGVFDSQIRGGKRYDLAGLARRRANATYYASHATDTTTGMSFAMDLTPLLADPALDVAAYVLGYIERFGQDVAARIARFS